MTTVDDAIELFEGDMARRRLAKRTRDEYSRYLGLFSDQHPVHKDVAQLSEDDCAQFLDRWLGCPGALSYAHSVLSVFFAFLIRARKLKASPMALVSPPKTPRPEDLDVVTVSTDDVRRMLEAARWPTEKLALAVLAYTGARRSAAAGLRRSDWDRESSRLRFFEKGGKVVWKPVPDELAALLERAERERLWSDDSGRSGSNEPLPSSCAEGGRWEPDGNAGLRERPDAFLIPPMGYGRPGAKRGDQLYRLVKKIANRAGVVSHVHALRAAFIVHYLELNGRDTIGAQHLAGHRSVATTERYWRRLEAERAMEPVRSLSWVRSDSSRDDVPNDATSGNTPPAKSRKERKSGKTRTRSVEPSAANANRT
jgi:integrase